MFDVEIHDHLAGTSRTHQFGALPRVKDGIKMRNRHGVVTNHTVKEVWFEEGGISGLFEAKVMVEEN